MRLPDAQPAATAVTSQTPKVYCRTRSARLADGGLTSATDQQNSSAVRPPASEVFSICRSYQIEGA